MKKFISAILIIALCFASYGCFGMLLMIDDEITEEDWNSLKNDNKVNITKSFSGEVDEVIDDFIKYDFTSDGPTIYEFFTTTHEILDAETNEDETTYFITHYDGEYAFINNVFSAIFEGYNFSAITLKKIQDNTYKVTMFYDNLDVNVSKKASKKYYSNYKYMKEQNIKKTQILLNKEAEEYLNKIGKNAKIINDKDIELTDLPNYNNLSIYDEFFDKGYPTWIGTREELINGKRYIYEAKSKKTGKEKYTITYTKTNEQGKILERYKVYINKNKYETKKEV